MPVIEGPKVELTFNTLLTVVAVIVCVFGVIVAIVKGVEAWQKISLRGRVTDLEGRMGKVEDRLELGNRRFRHQSDDMGQMLVTMQSLLMHFISGNDHEKLRETASELNAYMAQRTTRELEDNDEDE